MTENTENVRALIAKASASNDSADAMRFSQAACNAANALASLDHIARSNPPDKPTGG